MKLIYRAKWIIVVLFAIMFLFSFVVLFARGTAMINWSLLATNLLLIFVQIVNVVYGFMNKHKETGIALLVLLLLSIVLMWVIYIWSWNYTVKALTVGFE